MTRHLDRGRRQRGRARPVDLIGRACLCIMISSGGECDFILYARVDSSLIERQCRDVEDDAPGVVNALWHATWLLEMSPPHCGVGQVAKRLAARMLDNQYGLIKNRGVAV